MAALAYPPVNPSALKRVLRIHEFLKAGGPVTGQTIAARLKVSATTVKRDIDVMRVHSGAEIVWDPSTHPHFLRVPPARYCLSCGSPPTRPSP